MDEAEVHTFIYPNGHNAPPEWIWFAPLGLPFVRDCCITNRIDAMRSIWQVVEKMKDRKAPDKRFEIQVCGVISKRFYSRKERAEHKRWAADFIGMRELPAFDWEITVSEVISIRELPRYKESWLAVCAFAQIAAYITITVLAIHWLVRLFSSIILHR